MLSNKLQKIEYFSSQNNSNDGESLSISSKASKKKKTEKEFKNEIFVQKLKWCRVWTIYMNIVYLLNYIEVSFLRKIDKIYVPFQYISWGNIITVFILMILSKFWSIKAVIPSMVVMTFQMYMGLFSKRAVLIDAENKFNLLYNMNLSLLVLMFQHALVEKVILVKKSL